MAGVLESQLPDVEVLRHKRDTESKTATAPDRLAQEMPVDVSTNTILENILAGLGLAESRQKTWKKLGCENDDVAAEGGGGSGWKEEGLRASS